MHDALRVYTHVYALRRQSEQMRRFDHFQPFVHHRGAVNGDLPAHFPGRVPERFRRRDRLQLRRCITAERTARSGEYQLFHRVASARERAFQALEHCGVLAVHGQYSHAFFPRRPHHDAAARYQRFFIGEGNVVARPDRRQCGSESAHADDGRNGNICFRCRSLGKSLVAVQDIYARVDLFAPLARRGQFFTQPIRILPLSGAKHLRPELPRLGQQQFAIGAAGQHFYGIVRIGHRLGTGIQLPDDLKRLRAY